MGSIYRYLDKLQNHQMRQVQQISYDHTLRILDTPLSVAFYDVTTLYFEAAEEDDFRQNGFSKDGKHNQPQIVLGLFVSTGGYPLAYELFDGSKFEGHTMIPLIEAFKEKHQLAKIIVVADAGLMSSKNVQALFDNNLFNKYYYTLFTYHTYEIINKKTGANGNSKIVQFDLGVPMTKSGNNIQMLEKSFSH